MDDQDFTYSTSTELIGTKNYTLLATTTENHVVSVYISESGALGSTEIQCTTEYGFSVLAKNWDKNFIIENTSFDCVGDIRIIKNGSDSALVGITYKPNFGPAYTADSAVYCINCAGSSTSVSATTSTSTTPQYVNGFSYGDILIAFFLLVLVTNQFFGGILNRLTGRKQKANYKIRL